MRLCMCMNLYKVRVCVRGCLRVCVPSREWVSVRVFVCVCVCPCVLVKQGHVSVVKGLALSQAEGGSEA